MDGAKRWVFGSNHKSRQVTGQEPNIIFTSRWDKHPNEATIELAGHASHASHAWFLVAGSTHPMHSQLDNGEIIVAYDDGRTQRLPLHNPTTWGRSKGTTNRRSIASAFPALIRRALIWARDVLHSWTYRWTPTGQ